MLDEYYYVDRDLYTNFKDQKIEHNFIDNMEFEEYPNLCRIEVNSGEGMHPHFHITDHKDFDICICLYSRYYYTHQGPYGNGEKGLTESQITQLEDWLIKDSKQDPEYNNWEYLCKVWRDANPELIQFTRPRNRRMPKYKNLQEVPWHEPGFDPCILTVTLEGTVDFGGDLGECDIVACNEFWDLPHFHIVSKDRESFNICICTYSNNYFSHTGMCKKVLDEKQCKILNDWLKSIKVTEYYQYEYWDLIAMHQSESKFMDVDSVDYVQPNYSTMSEIHYKEVFNHGN